MTQAAIREQINQQIEVIKKVTEEARETKEGAIKFLTDAGILKEKADVKVETKKKK